jgi:hypothetical protein
MNKKLGGKKKEKLMKEVFVTKIVFDSVGMSEALELK